MQRIKILGILVGCLAAGMMVSAQAADVAKIGVIDFQRILENSSAGKYAQAEINKKGKQMETELTKKGQEIEETKKRLEREAMVMSKEMREQKEREMRIAVGDFQAMQKKYMEEFKAFENRLVQRIQKEVFEIVKEMGKSGGYLLIVEKRTGGVLYTPNSVDITDQLIQNYNQAFAKNPNLKE